jgi:hypothetical protein
MKVCSYAWFDIHVHSISACGTFDPRFANGWSIGAKFDGEFADRPQTYAGTATARYVWRAPRMPQRRAVTDAWAGGSASCGAAACNSPAQRTAASGHKQPTNHVRVGGSIFRKQPPRPWPTD